VADLDNDGDLDLIVNNLYEEAFLYESKANELGNSIIINLKGAGTNTYGHGAKVEIFHGENYQFIQHKTVRGFLSSSDPRVHFGVGEDLMIDSIRVTWTDGITSILKNVAVNQMFNIEQQNTTNSIPQIRTDQPYTTEVTNRILSKSFIHKENDFNEYAEQILLPHMFSKNGPFISKADINSDGLDDFFIGGAAGQAGRIYVQKNGRFFSKTFGIFNTDRGFEDMGSTFTDFDGDGDQDLIVVSGGSEFEEGHQLYRDRIYLNDGNGNFSKRQFLPSQSSGSCVAPHDFDGDGDIDLFIGGQVIANRYLHPPSSYLYINDGNQFEDKTEQLAPTLNKAGMIYSAIWTDLDGDSVKELILAGEWMPIQIYKLENGKLAESSKQYGLSKTEGWWQKVIASDLDRDGDMDLILGNQGENYKFRATSKKPFEIFVGDFDQSGTNDIFLAKHDKAKLVPIRGRECTSDQMPRISEKFPSFASFAYADLNQIIGSEIEGAIHKEAYLMSSIILENDNGQLKIRKLPPEAQFSTLLGIQVKDINDDGIFDLIIAGNKFDVEIETTAADASPGYILLGKGNLEFEAIHPSESGLMIPYNVKDIKLIDVAGKTHVLVGVNDEEMRILRTL
jgi:hypothetical protein